MKNKTSDEYTIKWEGGTICSLPLNYHIQGNEKFVRMEIPNTTISFSCIIGAGDIQFVPEDSFKLISKWIEGEKSVDVIELDDTEISLKGLHSFEDGTF